MLCFDGVVDYNYRIWGLCKGFVNVVFGMGKRIGCYDWKVLKGKLWFLFFILVDGGVYFKVNIFGYFGSIGIWSVSFVYV